MGRCGMMGGGAEPSRKTSNKNPDQNYLLLQAYRRGTTTDHKTRAF